MSFIEVTILMSVYREKDNELKEAIESILNQTYKDFEFLIINDGQEERINNIVNSYSDNRIKLIENEKNMGLAASLNKGIELAQGQYLIRMDADDIAHRDRIAKQIDFIKKHPQYSVVGARANVFDEDGVYAKIGVPGEVKKEQFIKGTPFIHPTMIIKKDDIIKIGGYPNYRRAQDYAMMMNMYANNYKGFIIDDVLLDYRMDSNGYKKKKFKYRIMETKIRAKYFYKMKINPIYYIWTLKPIIVGLIPKKILKAYHHKGVKK